MSSPFQQSYRPPFKQPADLHNAVGLEQPFTMNRTAPAPTQNAAAGASVANYGNAGDWASVLGGIGQGIQNASSSGGGSTFDRKDALEQKRRTLANMLNQALRRNQGMEIAQQGYGHDLNDYQAQIMQQIARGFTSAMQGTTGQY